MALVVLASLALVVSACNKSSSAPEQENREKPSATETTKAAVSHAEPVKFDDCSVLTLEDAKRILGPSARPFMHTEGCWYKATNPKGANNWENSVILHVRKYQSPAEESYAWEGTQLLRNLHPGRKNLEVLNGIGKEAYLDTVPNMGTIETTVIVHKDTSDFQLMEITDRPASPDALKAVAQKVAGQLP